MSFASKFNKKKLFTYECSNLEYISLEELYENEERVYPLRALLINDKSLYGPSPVAVIDGFYVNLPAFLLDDVKDIRNDRLAVSDINRGLVGFTIYKYIKERYNKTCYSIKWVDINPAE